MSGRASAEGDGHSYGILLLEMFTGRRPTSEAFRDGFTLHDYVEMSFPERVMEVMDPAAGSRSKRPHIAEHHLSSENRCHVFQSISERQNGDGRCSQPTPLHQKPLVEA